MTSQTSLFPITNNKPDDIKSKERLVSPSKNSDLFLDQNSQIMAKKKTRKYVINGKELSLSEIESLMNCNNSDSSIYSNNVNNSSSSSSSSLSLSSLSSITQSQFQPHQQTNEDDENIVEKKENGSSSFPFYSALPHFQNSPNDRIHRWELSGFLHKPGDFWFLIASITNILWSWIRLYYIELPYLFLTRFKKSSKQHVLTWPWLFSMGIILARSMVTQCKSVSHVRFLELFAEFILPLQRYSLKAWYWLFGSNDFEKTETMMVSNDDDGAKRNSKENLKIKIKKVSFNVKLDKLLINENLTLKDTRAALKIDSIHERLNPSPTYFESFHPEDKLEEQEKIQVEFKDKKNKHKNKKEGKRKNRVYNNNVNKTSIQSNHGSNFYNRTQNKPLANLPQETGRINGDGTYTLKGEWIEVIDTNSDNNINERQKSKSNVVLLYFHGGAHIICSPGTHRYMVSSILKEIGPGARAFVVDYRKAPEHPFPAAVHDAFASFLYLTEPEHKCLVLDEENSAVDQLGVDPKDIVLAGDSAGGNLVLAFLLYMRDYVQPVVEPKYSLPLTSILLSAWIDITSCTPNMQKKDSYCYAPATIGQSPHDKETFSHKTTQNYAGLYLQGDPKTTPNERNSMGDDLRWKWYSHLARHPLVSPVFAANLSGLGDILIQSGTHDRLLDENRLLAAKLGEANQVPIPSYSPLNAIFDKNNLLEDERDQDQTQDLGLNLNLDNRSQQQEEKDHEQKNYLVSFPLSSSSSSSSIVSSPTSLSNVSSSSSSPLVRLEVYRDMVHVHQMFELYLGHKALENIAKFISRSRIQNGLEEKKDGLIVDAKIKQNEQYQQQYGKSANDYSFLSLSNGRGESLRVGCENENENDKEQSSDRPSQQNNTTNSFKTGINTNINSSNQLDNNDNNSDKPEKIQDVDQQCHESSAENSSNSSTNNNKSITYPNKKKEKNKKKNKNSLHNNNKTSTTTSSNRKLSSTSLTSEDSQSSDLKPTSPKSTLSFNSINTLVNYDDEQTKAELLNNSYNISVNNKISPKINKKWGKVEWIIVETNGKPFYGDEGIPIEELAICWNKVIHSGLEQA